MTRFLLVAPREGGPGWAHSDHQTVWGAGSTPPSPQGGVCRRVPELVWALHLKRTVQRDFRPPLVSGLGRFELWKKVKVKNLVGLSFQGSNSLSFFLLCISIWFSFSTRPLSILLLFLSSIFSPLLCLKNSLMFPYLDSLLLFPPSPFVPVFTQLDKKLLKWQTGSANILVESLANRYPHYTNYIFSISWGWAYK